MVKMLSCGLRDPGSIPGRGSFLFFLISIFKPPRALACKIPPDDLFYWNDATLTFLAAHVPFPWFVRIDLTDVWPYGRVFETTSGFHGEFFTLNDPKVSLIHLGNNERDALSRMRRLTDQHMYIISLKELQ